MNLKSSFIILLLNSRLLCQSKIIKKDNGLTYITGRGCGTLTPIKHFDSMPKDISELTCAIIKPDKIVKPDRKIFGKSKLFIFCFHILKTFLFCIFQDGFNL